MGKTCELRNSDENLFHDSISAYCVSNYSPGPPKDREIVALDEYQRGCPLVVLEAYYHSTTQGRIIEPHSFIQPPHL